MSEVKVPTDAEKLATANVLKNIREILKRGMFFGENSGYVHEAMMWLDKCVADMTPPALAPDLSVVPDEVPVDGQA